MMSSDEEPCLVRVVGENVNLIRGESEDEVVEKKEDKITCYLFLLTTFTALGGFLFGYDTGVISGAMIPLKKQFQLSKLLQESIVSVALVGAILGSLGSGVVNNRLGRRPSVILGGFLFTAGSLVMGLANGSTVLLLGRFLVGLGIGLVSMVVPVYIAEAAPSRMRGQLVTTNVAFITFGQFFASVLNGVFTSTISQQGWRLMLGAAALPSFILMVGFYWMPESPRWLISKGMDIYRGILEAEFFEEKQIKTELKEHSKLSEIEKVTKVEKVDKSTQFFLLEEVVAYKRMREVADKIHRSTFIESDLPRRVMQMKKENQALNNSLQDLKKMLKRDRLNKVVDTLAPENKVATGNDDVTLPAPNKLNPSSVNFLNQQTNQQLPSHEVYPRISEVKSMHPSAAPVQSTIYHNMYQPRYDALSLYQKQYNMLAHQQQMHQLGMYSPEYYHKLTAFYQQRTLIEQQQNQAYQQQQQQQKQHFNYQQSQQVEQLTREQMQRNQAMFYNSPQNRPQESLLRQKLRERVAHKERKVSSGIAQCTPEQRWRHNVKRDSLNQKIFRLSNRQPPIIQQTIQKIHQQKTPVIAVDDALVANYSLVVAKPHQLNAAASQAVNEAIETTATQVESNSSAEVESTASSCSNSFIEKLANYRPELQPLNVVIPKESNVSQQSSVDQSIIKQVDMNNNVQKVGYTLTPPPSP